ncbi:hypothetical protein PR202_gb28166 [Eleusine coracana subsp. coracana]|uniref:BTB domain-containing protein n=1 Tax=Eleusine coracana subsp. coracana TaxID=191504 RepID=A0AAV5FWS6_ELECO|nr:hypothetical protein PR202_gb28166 [Eleusine coracana subsp. coracana]
MEPGRTNVTEAVRSVQHLKIEGYSATRTGYSSEHCIKSTWNVSGYDWEVHIYHADINKHDYTDPVESWMTLKLVFLGPCRGSRVRANLGCRLVDPSRTLEPSETKNVCSAFLKKGKCSSELLLLRSDDVPSSGYLKSDSLIIECTITVLKELPKIVVPAQKDVPLPVPPSDLHQHLGALLQSHKGGDVTLVLVPSGERFLAHKCILAARSPVFMAEFFGEMNERSSQSVQIEGVQPAAFKAMLHFI